MDYTKHFSTKSTPQTQPIPGKNQVQNSAGGYTFSVDAFKRLDRFLILGSEGGSYYATEQKLSTENAENVLECIEQDGPTVVNRIVEVSQAGRAPSNDPAIFALALCTAFGDQDTKCAAYAAITKVCRIGTHLFTFCQNIQNLRGWSKGLAKGVAKFYTEKNPDQVAYQTIKYRQRNGWEHKDVLRLAHVKPNSDELNDILRWTVGKTNEPKNPLIRAFLKVQDPNTPIKEVISLVNEYRLPWEALPTEHLADTTICKALLPSMPLTALLRSLGKFTANETLKPLSSETSTVVAKFSDPDYIKKSRLHPLNILNALVTYNSGGGYRSSSTWNTIPAISDALDKAFYLAFDNVIPSNKRTMLCLDVSGSMAWQNIAKMNLNPAQASCALALVTAKTEPNYHVMGFSDTLEDLKIAASDTLDSAAAKISKCRMGRTDCSLPMEYAIQNNLEVDTFIIYTDSETYAGKRHPAQALEAYRKHSGIDAKLIVVGMVSNGFTIADPNDPGMLDVVGFSTSTPSVIAEFSKN